MFNKLTAIGRSTLRRFGAAVVALGLVAAVSSLGMAQEGGLYAAPPPPDAAFLRVLNSGAAGDLSVGVGSAAYTVPAASVSDYQYVTRGEYDASGGATLHVALEAQKFYTIVVGPDGAASLIEDEALANPARAGLYFYNATGEPLQLDAKMDGKQAAVFKDVAPGTVAFREVKPFQVAFVVVGGGKEVELPLTNMVSQQGLSVVAVAAADGVAGFQSVNAVDVQ